MPRLSVRSKLLADFGTILVLMALVGFVGWRSTENL